MNRQSMCSSKRAYRSRAAALRNAHKHSSGRRVYQCPRCGKWHWTDKGHPGWAPLALLKLKEAS